MCLIEVGGQVIRLLSLTEIFTLVNRSLWLHRNWVFLPNLVWLWWGRVHESCVRVILEVWLRRVSFELGRWLLARRSTGLVPIVPWLKCAINRLGVSNYRFNDSKILFLLLGFHRRLLSSRKWRGWVLIRLILLRLASIGTIKVVTV